MSFFILYRILLKNDSLLRILRFPGYFETTLFRTFFHSPWDFEIAGFDCQEKGEKVKFYGANRLQNSRFFLKFSKEIGKAWRKSLTRAKRASLTRLVPDLCLTARAYLNTQKYGLFCSLHSKKLDRLITS